MNMNPEYLPQIKKKELENQTETNSGPDYTKYFVSNKNSPNKYIRDFHAFEINQSNLSKKELAENREKIKNHLFKESPAMSDKDFLELLKYLENQIIDNYNNSSGYNTEQEIWPAFLSSIINKLTKNKDINCLKKISAEMTSKRNDIVVYDDGTSYKPKNVYFKEHDDNIQTKSVVYVGGDDIYFRWNNQYVYVSEIGQINIAEESNTKNINKVIGKYKSNITAAHGYFSNDKEVVNSFFNIKDSQSDALATLGLLLTESFSAGFVKRVGFDPLEMKPEKVVQFLAWLSSENQKQLPKIEKFTKKYGINGVQTFLSVEQGGSQMGDKIVSLGEQLPGDQAEEIFKGYGDLIDSAQRLSSKISSEISKNDNNIEGVDVKKLPNELVDSLMLRAKDILIGAEKVLENQKNNQQNEKLNTADVTNAVLGINKLVSMLASVNEVSGDYEYKKLESTGNKAGEYLNKYLVTDKEGFEYNLKVFIRPRAEADAQARVNIELSFDTQKPNERLQKAFYNEIINHKENKKVAGSVLRIGIDRDDYNYEGAVSLDIGRSERETDKYSRTGDVLGKLLSMTSNEGHHETTAFSKEFADKENFAKITTLLAQYFQQH